MKKIVPVKDLIICKKNPDPTYKYVGQEGLVGYTKIESVPTYKVIEAKVINASNWPCEPPKPGTDIIVSSSPTVINFGDGGGTTYIVTPDQFLGTIISDNNG